MQSIGYSPHDAEVFERSVENRKSFFGKFFGNFGKEFGFSECDEKADKRPSVSGI